MSMGYGYEITGLDMQDIHRLAMDAATVIQQTEQAHTTNA